MRAKEFTYQKTKKVKTITKFQGISIDLTVQEAADLREIVGNVSTGSEAVAVRQLVTGLYSELTKFWVANGSVRPNIEVAFISAPQRKGSFCG